MKIRVFLTFFIPTNFAGTIAAVTIGSTGYSSHHDRNTMKRKIGRP
jgi:hypothetical protein